MRLVIAEKPELGKAIARNLGDIKEHKKTYIVMGNGDIVTWCFGHILELYKPEDYDEKYKTWSLDHLPFYFPEHSMKPIEDHKAHVNMLLKFISQADELVHAGDPDSEGQLLIDEVIEYANARNKPAKRLLINDLTDKLVKRAIDDMRPNSEFYGLYQSALARSVADQTYGYNMSRAYTLYAKKAGMNDPISVGRVQTPVLALIVSRDLQHENHAASGYYSVAAKFSNNDLSFKASYVIPDSVKVDDKKRLIDAEHAERVSKECTGSDANVLSVATEDKADGPPLPYNLATLTSDANRIYGIKAADTLKITQSLREKHRLITYNRSDCPYLSDEQHEDAPNVLAAVAKNVPFLEGNSAGDAFYEKLQLVSECDTSIKSKAFNSKKVSAHHAIVPTESTPDMSKLNAKEMRIYGLIVRMYIAQFMTNKEYKQTKVAVECAGHNFRVTASSVTSPGWSDLFNKDKAETEDNDEAVVTVDLSSLDMGESIKCDKCTADKKKTKPLPYYTEGTLIKDMTRISKYVKDDVIKNLLLEKDKDLKGEQGGIGTSATRPAIIETLLRRGLIDSQGKKIISTGKGRSLIEALPGFATKPDMTALWFSQQSEIEAGTMQISEFMEGILSQLRKHLGKLKVNGLNISDPDAVKCPQCDTGILTRRKGKYGFFHGCSNYPECKAMYKDNKGKPVLEPPKRDVTDHDCPKCGSKLVRHKSKKKKGMYWYGCSSFPKCDFTCFESDGKPKIDS